MVPVDTLFPTSPSPSPAWRPWVYELSPIESQTGNEEVLMRSRTISSYRVTSRSSTAIIWSSHTLMNGLTLLGTSRIVHLNTRVLNHNFNFNPRVVGKLFQYLDYLHACTTSTQVRANSVSTFVAVLSRRTLDPPPRKSARSLILT